MAAVSGEEHLELEQLLELATTTEETLRPAG